MAPVASWTEPSLHWHASESLCLPWLQLSAPFWLAFSAAWKEEERENHVPSQARPETDIPVGGKGK